jgi:hypothetical protein
MPGDRTFPCSQDGCAETVRYEPQPVSLAAKMSPSGSMRVYLTCAEGHVREYRLAGVGATEPAPVLEPAPEPPTQIGVRMRLAPEMFYEAAAEHLADLGLSSADDRLRLAVNAVLNLVDEPDSPESRPVSGDDPRPASALYERLAAIEHDRWGEWQEYVHNLGRRDEAGNLVLPAAFVSHWERQIATPYADLSEAERQRDRVEVDRYWPFVLAALAGARIGGAMQATRSAPTELAEATEAMLDYQLAAARAEAERDAIRVELTRLGVEKAQTDAVADGVVALLRLELAGARKIIDQVRALGDAWAGTPIEDDPEALAMGRELLAVLPPAEDDDA